MPRPCLQRRISQSPSVVYFKPAGKPLIDLPEARLRVEELEAVRLADLLGLDMQGAAEQMGVSRHTFGRILRQARSTIAQALVEGMALRVEGGHYALELGAGQSTNHTEQGVEIMEDILVAVPSDAPGGLIAKPSAHFGHCDAYTVARIANQAVVEVDVVYNQGHEHGACVEPVRQLAQKGVKALLAGGMGQRPLEVMRELGLDVYYTANLTTVGEVLDHYAQGKLKPFGTDQLCRGNCSH